MNISSCRGRFIVESNDRFLFLRIKKIDKICKLFSFGFNRKTIFFRQLYSYLSTYLPTREVDMTKFISEINFECCGVEKNVSGIKLVNFTDNRSPQGDHEIFFSSLAIMLDYLRKKISLTKI